MCASVHIQKIISFTSSNLDALLNHLIIFFFFKKKNLEKIPTDIEFMKAHVIVTTSEISSNVVTRSKFTVVHFMQVRSVVKLLFFFYLFIKDKTKLVTESGF